MHAVLLSKGYFSSTNVLREVRATVEKNKRLVPVQEADLSKGGAPIDELKADCPAKLREGVFGADNAPHNIIVWLRLK